MVKMFRFFFPPWKYLLYANFSLVYIICKFLFISYLFLLIFLTDCFSYCTRMSVLSVLHRAFSIHISTVGNHLLGKVNTEVHKKKINIFIYIFVEMCYM